MHRIPASYKLIAMFVFVILTGCQTIEPIEFKKITGVKIEQRSGGAFMITANLELHNPNSAKFIIESTDIDVYVDESYLGKLQIPSELEIPRNADFEATCSIDLKLSNMLVTGMGILSKLRKGEVNARFKGTIKARFMFSSKIILVDVNQKIKAE